MSWIYKDRIISSHSDLDSKVTDIVYILKFTDGTKYIGKKKIRTSQELTPLKNGIQRSNHLKYVNRIIRNKRTQLEEVYVNKPFINYVGSSECNIGKEIESKEILYLCTNSRTATYLEEKLLFINEAIESKLYNNANIGGRYFDNCLEGLYDV